MFWHMRRSGLLQIFMRQQQYQQPQDDEEPLKLGIIDFVHQPDTLAYLKARRAREFDIALLCLDLSRRSLTNGQALLTEAGRVASLIVVIDLAASQPWNTATLSLTGLLALQGSSVLAHALQWRRRGGVDWLARRAKLKICARASLHRGALEMLFLASFENYHAKKIQQLLDIAGVD